MDRLAARAHRDELGDPLRAGLGLLRGLDAIEDRVAVRAVERVEELASAGVLCERRREVIGHGRRAGAIVGALPPAVALGALHLGHAWRLELASREERLGLRAIDLRPWALRGPWREPLQPGLC